MVHFGEKGPTMELISDMEKIDYPRKEILVFDNDPGREVSRILEKAHREWHVVAPGRNLGYCRAVNQGMRKLISLGADYILLLNNDVRIREPLVAPLVEAMEADEKSGSAGPKILYPDGRIWCAGGVFHIGPSVTRLRGMGRRDDGRYPVPEYVDYFPGACVLLRVEALEKAGFLDESYWMYMEDVDLALRMKEAGYKCLYVPWARVVHNPSLSTGGGPEKRKYLTALNQVRFLKKHGGLRLWTLFFMFDVLGLPLSAFYWLFKGKGISPAIWKAKGLFHGIIGRKPEESWNENSPSHS